MSKANAMELVWEEVDIGMNRAAVPGGWIVQQYDQSFNERLERWEWQMVAAFFLPDEDHDWLNNAPRVGEVGDE